MYSFLQELVSKVNQEYKKLLNDKINFGKLIEFSTTKFTENEELKEIKRLFEEEFNQKSEKVVEDKGTQTDEPENKRVGDEDEGDQRNEPENKRDGDEDKGDQTNEDENKKDEDKGDEMNEDECKVVKNGENQSERHNSNVDEAKGNDDEMHMVNPDEKLTNEEDVVVTPVHEISNMELGFVTPGSTYANPIVHEVIDSLQCFYNDLKDEKGKKLVIENDKQSAMNKERRLSFPSYSLGLTQDFEIISQKFQDATEKKEEDQEKKEGKIDAQVEYPDSEETEDDETILEIKEKRVTKPSAFLCSPYNAKVVCTERFIERNEVKVTNRIFSRQGNCR